MKHWLIAVVLVGCGSKKTEEPDIATPSSAVDWGGPTIDCGALLTTADIRKACGERVAAVLTPTEGETFEDPKFGKTKRVCARTFKIAKRPDAEVVGFDIVALDSEESARSLVTSGKPMQLDRFGGITQAHGARGRLHVSTNTLSKTPLCKDGVAKLFAVADERLGEILNARRRVEIK